MHFSVTGGMPKRRKCRRYHRVRRYRFIEHDSSFSTASSIDDESEVIETELFNTVDTNVEHLTKCTNNGDDIDFLPIRTSSPLVLDSDNNLSTSRSTLIDSSDDDDYSDGEMLYSGSSISVNEFSTRLSKIASTHSLSDLASKEILKLFADSLPVPNKVPSLYKYNSSSLNTVSATTKINCDNGDIFILPFNDQLVNILARYPRVMDLSVNSSANGYSDISTGKMFPRVVKQTIYFIMNTDGLSPVLSRKLQVWPILLSMVNLPPQERRRLCNIIMIGFYIGYSPKPDWNIFLESLITYINGVYLFRGKPIHCELIALVADSPARCSCCFIQNMNAK